MVGENFDIFVLGSEDSSEEGQMRLVSTFAGRTGASPAMVSKAIAQGNLRVAHGLPRDRADSLAKKLKALGAVVAIRPAQGGGGAGGANLVGSGGPGGVARPQVVRTRRSGRACALHPSRCGRRGIP